MRIVPQVQKNMQVIKRKNAFTINAITKNAFTNNSITKTHNLQLMQLQKTHLQLPFSS